MEHIIELIRILAWPVVVLMVTIFLRKPIKSALSFMKKVKYGEVEVEFDSQLKQIKNEVAASNEKQIVIRSLLRADVYRLVDVSPSAAIIEAWKDVIHIAEEKAQELAPSDNKARQLRNNPLRHLAYIGALHPRTTEVIRMLQDLRNKAAHAPSHLIDRSNALDFIELSISIISQIKTIKELPQIKLTALTFIIIELNHLLDSGKYDHLTLEEIKKAVEEKRVIPYLTETTKGDADFTLFESHGPNPHFTEYYHEQLHQIWGGYAGRERKKWGVENKGIALLLAWTNEIIQQGSGWYPRS